MNTPRRASALGFFRAAAGFLLGVQCFYTFGVTLALFRGYPSPEAGRIVGVLFPTYYLWVYACAGLSLVLLLFSRRRARRTLLTFAVLLVAALLIATVDRILGPLMAEAKLSNEQGTFRRLHGISMILNLGSILLVLAASFLPREIRDAAQTA